jgi:SAM-dependent methyltransferase
VGVFFGTRGDWPISGIFTRSSVWSYDGGSKELPAGRSESLRRPCGWKAVAARGKNLEGEPYVKSYVETKLSPVARLGEARNLYIKYTRNVSKTVKTLVEDAQEAEGRISELIGQPVDGLRMLEIGPGQQLAQLAYFSRKNDVVGIDLDTILPALTFRGVLAMTKNNGWMRTAKTVTRKALGIDRKVRSQLAAELAVSSLPRLQVERMDATSMSYPNDFFDAVYSRSVFEHLPDPAAVLAEARRVTRPGGAIYVRLHLYTSDSGNHDSRIYIDERAGLPYWAHLRPEHAHKVQSNTYLNKLRLCDWEDIFRKELPGCSIRPLVVCADHEREELTRLRAAGELIEYSDEELLAATVEVGWHKPS